MKRSKKIMARCDMEGLTGVVSYDQVIPGRPEYAYGQSILMAELLALIEGLQAGGCDQIVCYDEHFDGRNIDITRLPEGVSVICGRPPYRADWPGGLDDSFTGLILLGLHSRHGTPNGLLNHTYEHDIREISLNGVTVGEIGMEAAIAGDFGVPLQMVIGDSAMIAETDALVDGIVGVTVKESLSETAALCYPLKVTTARIQAAARQVAETPPCVRPYYVQPPVKLQVTLNDSAYLDALHMLYSKQMDARTLVIQGDSVREAWGTYWQIKLNCRQTAGLSIHADLEHLAVPMKAVEKEPLQCLSSRK